MLEEVRRMLLHELVQRGLLGTVALEGEFGRSGMYRLIIEEFTASRY